jgi:hypothetical protein
MLSIRQDEKMISIRLYNMTDPNWRKREYPNTPDNAAWLERHLNQARHHNRSVTVYESSGATTYVLSNRKRYRVIDGTSYDVRTPLAVCKILEYFRHNHRQQRIKITYGKNGIAWEGSPESGYVGRSTGNVKIPLLIHNARAFGGGAILDHCIVRIEYANKRNGGILYDAIVTA